MALRRGGRPVLVLTSRDDVTADDVVLALTVRDVPVARVDPAEFPATLSLSVTCEGDGWTGTVVTEHREFRLEDVRSVYYRRPRAPVPSPGLAGAEREWATREAVAGLYGVFGALPCLYVNHPARNMSAAAKPRQLALATRCGLTVPRTLVTNDPGEARYHASRVGPLVCKPIVGGLVVEDGEPKVAYASVVHAVEIDDSVRATAHLFQEWVDKRHDVRLTVVGEQMFAAEIHATSDAARVDWRTDYTALEYRVTAVPAGVADGVRRLMRRLGLAFAALDFAVRADGRWVMLEVNPNGQWGWIEGHTGLPIAAAVADLLATGTDGSA